MGSGGNGGNGAKPTHGHKGSNGLDLLDHSQNCLNQVIVSLEALGYSCCY